MSGKPTETKLAADAARAGAHTQLLDHLAALEEAGHAIPCRGPRKDLWLSDHPASQKQAATGCLDCPAINRCATYATEHETHRAGTWAGLRGKTSRDENPQPARNSTRTPRKSRTRRKAA